jgi:hypothetical protein
MKSITEIGAEYGKTKQAVMVWRAKAEDKYGDLSFTPKGKAKLYAAPEIEKILEFAPSSAFEVVEAEVVDSAPSGVMSLLFSPEATGAKVSALAVQQAPDNSIAVARQTLESKADLDTAVSNFVQGMGSFGVLAEQIGGAVVQQFGNTLRSTIASGIDKETKSVLSQFGLGQSSIPEN